LSHLDILFPPCVSQFNKCNINKHSIIEEQKIKNWKNIYLNVNKKHQNLKIIDDDSPASLLQSCFVDASLINNKVKFNKSTNSTTNYLINLNMVTINDISKSFNLNEKQDIILKLFTKEDNLSKRIGMFGEGGTGKSQTIKAIIEFYLKTNNLNQLLVSAPTGSAACLIHGINILYII
jgi:hypothetical protein